VGIGRLRLDEERHLWSQGEYCERSGQQFKLLPRGQRGQCPGSEREMKKNHDLLGTVESAQSWSHQKKRFVTQILRVQEGLLGSRP
jgi:hypothetical protein